jgi:16S rRNA (guanine966-N2)-methyltransferase
MALFNMIDVEGLTVLDAFAGTGALGIEALSRGAKSLTFIEQDKKAARIIDVNITTLALETVSKLFVGSLSRWLNQNNPVKTPKFDLILADPPYHRPQFSTVFRLLDYLQPNGLMILSYTSRGTTPSPNGVVVVDNRSYGEASLAIYRLDS